MGVCAVVVCVVVLCIVLYTALTRYLAGGCSGWPDGVDPPDALGGWLGEVIQYDSMYSTHSNGSRYITCTSMYVSTVVHTVDTAYWVQCAEPWILGIPQITPIGWIPGIGHLEGLVQVVCVVHVLL